MGVVGFLNIDIIFIKVVKRAIRVNVGAIRAFGADRLRRSWAIRGDPAQVVACQPSRESTLMCSTVRRRSSSAYVNMLRLLKP